MKIYVLSDIHLEFEEFTPPTFDFDIVVLAGDISVGTDGLEWAIHSFPHTPVIYVLGNHEHYESNLQNNLNFLIQKSEGTNVHVLENKAVTINGITFLGCTLWTDFKLNDQQRSSKNLATRYISDYDAISFGKNNRKLTTTDTQDIHDYSFRWLRSEIKRKANKRVIVTHHAPSIKSIPNHFFDEGLKASYASHLDEFIKNSNADLWIHGHIHSSSMYEIGNTQVICNPRGYSKDANSYFNPRLLVDI